MERMSFVMMGGAPGSGEGVVPNSRLDNEPERYSKIALMHNSTSLRPPCSPMDLSFLESEKI